MMRAGTKVMAAALAMLTATPAPADVKAGVDAWSRGDYRAAVEQWRPLANAGDADAQFNLGQAYKLGRGVPVDAPVSLEWFRKAAEQGHPQAQANYGLSLFQEDRKSAALPWLEKAAARDEKRSQLVLGTMLFNGDAVPKDWTRAYALVTRSSQQGLEQGSQTLAQMDRYIPEAQRRQGTELARRIEADGRGAALATPTRAPAPVPSPRSTPAPERQQPGASYARPETSPLPATRATSPAPRPTQQAARPVAPPRKPAASPATPRPAGGAWRAQLGAFRDAGNARALWSRVGGKVGGSAAYVAGGGLTRLQATGFASREDAQRGCARAGLTCIVSR